MNKPLAKSAYLNEEQNILLLVLTDGSLVSEDLNKYPEFAKASKKQKNNFELIPSGSVVVWDKLDVHLSVEQIVKDNKIMKKTTISFEEFLDKQYGKTGTVKRKKADARLKEIEKKQVEKARKKK